MTPDPVFCNERNNCQSCTKFSTDWYVSKGTNRPTFQEMFFDVSLPVKAFFCAEKSWQVHPNPPLHEVISHWWQPEIRGRKPVEVASWNPMIYEVLAPSQVVPDFVHQQHPIEELPFHIFVWRSLQKQVINRISFPRGPHHGFCSKDESESSSTSNVYKPKQKGSMLW